MVLKWLCRDVVELKLVWLVMCFSVVLLVFSRCCVCVRCWLSSYWLKVVLVRLWKCWVKVCWFMLVCVVRVLILIGLVRWNSVYFSILVRWLLLNVVGSGCLMYCVWLFWWCGVIIMCFVMWLVIFVLWFWCNRCR